MLNSELLIVSGHGKNPHFQVKISSSYIISYNLICVRFKKLPDVVSV